MAPPRIHTSWDNRVERGTGVAYHESFEVQNRIGSCRVSVDNLLCELRHVVTSVGLRGYIERIGSELWKPVEKCLHESVVVLGSLGVVSDVVSSIAVGVLLVRVRKSHSTGLFDENHGRNFVPRMRVDTERQIRTAGEKWTHFSEEAIEPRASRAAIRPIVLMK
jgi:hypothetical protein